MTRELSAEMETFGVGIVGETGIAEGFFDRSMFLFVVVVVIVEEVKEL